MKILVATLLAIASLPAQQPRFNERVDVARVMIDVRVVDAAGNAVLGLEASEFDVRIDGRRARVESALWETDAGSEGAERASAALAAIPGRSSSPSGGLVVFLFQKSLEAGRITGLMRMLIDTT